MKLGIKERLILIGTLPEKGSMESQIRVRNIRKKLEISSKEVDEINLKTNEGGGLQWNGEMEKIKNVTFLDGEKQVLKDAVKGLDEKEEITVHNLDLCEMISKM
jgi:hypothetical protein